MPHSAAKGPIRLGDILLGARQITQHQLSIALEQQKRTGGRLGEVMVSLGFITEFDLYNTLAEQLGYEFIANPESQVDSAVVALVSEGLAKQHRTVPLRMEGNALLVATSEPLNFMGIDDISLHSGRQVKVAVATDKAVQRAILRAYGMGAAPDGQADQSEGLKSAFDLEESGDGGTVRLVNNLVIQALSQRATDIHIDPSEHGVRVRYRIDGVMQESSPLPKSALHPVLSRIKVMAGMDIAERRLPQDGRIEVELQGRRLDLRVATVPTVFGEKVAIRILDRSATVRGLGDIGLEEETLAAFRGLLARPNGMLLVTGPTGSGKTTTLMAALAELNVPARHVLTVEDPVEYHLPGVNQVQVNLKTGLTFASGLRSFLRQDPDVIMVGEIRDGETADIAVRAALTGHLVLSTLHTNQAAGAPGRLIDMGVEPFLMASSLIGVLSQRLVRQLCSRCREPYIPEAGAREQRLLAAAGIEQPTLYRAKGCGQCEGIGYRGRLCIVELLPVNAEVRELITARASSDRVEAAARKAGMHLLWQDGLRKAARGLTTVEEVRRVVWTEV